MEGEDCISPPTVSSVEEEKLPTHRARRSRVSLACQRCKQRKQKCNGDQPSCARCTRLSLECHYVMPIYPKPGQAKQYIKALEDRVAELETLLTKGGDKTASRDHWAERTDEKPDQTELESIQPLLNAVRDLSLDVAGSYVGGASTITLGRALESALAGKTQLILPQVGFVEERRRYEGSVTSETGSLPGTSSFQLSQIPSETADKMVNSYLNHLYANFPIIYSFDVLELHNNRHNLNDIYKESILNLIYGLGGHFLEKTGDLSGPYNPERHYNLALDNREAILRLGDTRSLTYLLLLGQHCVRMPKDPGAWTLFGLAMKMCIELGLHRQKRSSKLSLESELNKRLFWSCYAWDRELAIVMGRPPSISDHDIDVELPLDVDEANQNLEALQHAAKQDRLRPAYPQTTMSCFIHLLRLKVLESDIQHKVYRVDKTTSSDVIYKTTDMFLEKLYAWKEAIPQQSTNWDSRDSPNFKGDEYRRYDSYMASYFKSIRVLLQPRLYEKIIDERYLKLCAGACRGVCETYKRLHNRIPLVFSTVSLQTVFLAGLTLVYCMWHDSSNSNGFKSVGALTDCTIILYVMTERWPASKKYRDLFEAVKKSVLDAIVEGKHTAGTAVDSMKDSMQTSLQSLQVDPTTEIPEDLEQMISDMTGETISFWDDIGMSGIQDPLDLPASVDDGSQMFSLSDVGWGSNDRSFWYSNGYLDRNHESVVP